MEADPTAVVSHGSYQSASPYLGPGALMPPDVTRRVPYDLSPCPQLLHHCAYRAHSGPHQVLPLTSSHCPHP